MHLAQKENFFPAMLVLPCQLPEEAIRSRNACMLSEMGEPLYFPLFELEKGDAILCEGLL